MNKDPSAPDAIRVWHETSEILEGVIQLSINAEASHFKSTYVNNMHANTNEASATIQLFGEGGVSTTTTHIEHNVSVARICAFAHQ